MALYNDYSSYVKRVFGHRVQKISINTGYSCPNRDGSIGTGGCTYCNIGSIRPGYALPSKSITRQLEEGAGFFSKRYKTNRFFAYFQSYTNTYAGPEELKRAYTEALNFPGVEGIIIATRPDCINQATISLLEEISSRRFVSVELGIESTEEETLTKINRCHTYQKSIEAVILLASLGIHTCGHLILGFPWETKETMVSHAKKLSELPLDSVKLHHLQILKHTQLARDYCQNKFALPGPEEYLGLIIEFLQHLRQDISVQRFIAQAPEALLIAPHWGKIKNYEFTELVKKALMEKGTCQGALFTGHGPLLGT